MRRTSSTTSERIAWLAYLAFCAARLAPWQACAATKSSVALSDYGDNQTEWMVIGDSYRLDEACLLALTPFVEGAFELSDERLRAMTANGVPTSLTEKFAKAKERTFKTREEFETALGASASPQELAEHKTQILRGASTTLHRLTKLKHLRITPTLVKQLEGMDVPPSVAVKLRELAEQEGHRQAEFETRGELREALAKRLSTEELEQHGEVVLEYAGKHWARAFSGGLELESVLKEQLSEEELSKYRGFLLAQARVRPALVRDIGGRTSNAIEIEATFPEESGIKLERRLDFSQHAKLSLDVYVPTWGPRTLKCILYVRTAELLWYETFQEVELERGCWTSVTFDISRQSRRWRFKNHYKPWDGYVQQDLRVLGIKFFSDLHYSGPQAKLYVADILLHRLDRDRRRRGAVAKCPVFNLKSNLSQVPLYEKFELTFNLSRTYSNPFDPDVVDVQVHFTSPTGKGVSIPAFLYQDYLRKLTNRKEVLVPVGRSEWKARFAPTELGTYRYFIEVDDGELFHTQQREFEAVASKSPGFVRISPRDRNYFEFDNGEQFYPIGHNTVAPFDVRNADILGISMLFDEGTFAYARFFGRMSKHGENLARVWMASWWVGIEWTRKYDVNYRDLGRYSLANAWKLDQLLECAKENGLYLQLTFSTFGHFKTGFEGDWPYNPYNSDNGGPLPMPKAFFTSQEAKRLFKRRLRYILARWAYSPTLMCWEVFNEIDLSEGYNYRDPRVANWHREMIRYLKKHDPAQHITTTSVLYWQRNDLIWRLPEIEYINAHIFDTDLVNSLRQYYEKVSRYGKLVMVTEAGSTVWGRNPTITKDYMHIALWCSYMMPFAGVAMPWWWNFIDQHNLYHIFEPIAKFAEGEERRGLNLRMATPTVGPLPQRTLTRKLAAISLQNETKAYVWVYDTALLNPSQERPVLPPEEALVILSGLKPGKYVAEFWDTYQGQVIRTSPAEAKGDGTLALSIPKVDRDLACKIRPIAKN